jgi:hypothetical protein
MHIVTYQSTFHDFKKAMNSTNGLAVMSFFIEVSRSLTISISSEIFNVQFGSIYKKRSRFYRMRSMSFGWQNF